MELFGSSSFSVILVAMFLNCFPEGGVFLCWRKDRDNHVF